jgi:membrane-associated phospholipid phosphatase
MPRRVRIAWIVAGMLAGTAMADANTAQYDDWYPPTPIRLSSDADAPSGAPPAPRSGPESPISFDYLELLWDDTKEVVTEPARWDRDDWRNFGLISGGLIVSMAVLDKPIRDAAQKHRSSSSDNFFKNIEKFGTKQYGLPVLLGFYGYGAIADNYDAKATALDGFSASVLSALVTSTIKGVVGRARPNTGLGPHYFAPLSGNTSFPSGHATGAFAFASSIAGHYDDVWVATTAYTIASLVGIARIHLDAHWASDVVAGGLIGGLIGHHLVEFNRQWRDSRSPLVPIVGTDGKQLLLTWEY